MKNETVKYEFGVIISNGVFHPEQFGFLKESELGEFFTHFNQLDLDAQALVIALECSAAQVRDLVNHGGSIYDKIAYIDSKGFIENNQPNEKWVRQDWKIKDVVNAETLLGRKRFHYAGVTVTIKGMFNQATRQLVRVTDYIFEISNPLIFNDLKSRKFRNPLGVVAVIQAIVREMRYRDFDLGAETIQTIIDNNKDLGVSGTVKKLDDSTVFVSVAYTVGEVNKDFITCVSLDSIAK